MKTDIEIAQEASMIHIKEVAKKLDIPEEELDFYGEEAKTIPIFENPVDYPSDILAEMVRLAFAVRSVARMQEKSMNWKRNISVSEMP